MRAVFVVAALLLAGCTVTTHQSYTATLTYRVTAWSPTDTSRYRDTHLLLKRVPRDEAKPLKPADTEFLPREQAPPGTVVGDLLKCRVHQERNSVDVGSADSAETFGPCTKT